MNLIKMILKNTGFKQIRIQYNFTNIKKNLSLYYVIFACIIIFQF